MNFLMRSTTHVYSDREKPSSTATATAATPTTTVMTTTTPPTDGASSLESLMSDDPYAQVEHFDGEFEGENGAQSSKNDAPVLAKHLDVSEDEGWITIPYKELPENWNHVSDMQSLRSLDRSFLFPGEQVHILACLSACKQDTEIITPFKVAAVMSKNGMGHSSDKENGNVENRNDSVSGEGQLSPSKQEQKEDKLEKVKTDHPADASAGESLLRMEVHKRQTALLLEKFESSHFFARISESDEPLWSKRGSSEKSYSELNGQRISSFEIKDTAKNASSISAVIDRANFDATISGGVARNSVNCCALPNGDIVVLLQVNVGVDFLRDPCIEILQYEKYQDKILSSENQNNSVHTNQDPCGALLKWILPLDNTLPLASRPLSPPQFSLNSGIGNTSQRSNSSASPGSQLFSFGSHFRSYSMSALPQNTNAPNPPLKAASSKPSFDIEDWDQFPSQKLRKKNGVEELLSFRGVSLERERFSVCCGLEGIYTPGRRWRRKFEIIQPVEIHSFAADCNSEDLLCVQIKNVAPAHVPGIVIFIDAITIVYEEATKSGPPSSLPIACIEAGNDHSLPNLALRRGEEHSFILKPATSMSKNLKAQDESSQFSKVQSPNSAKSSLSSKSPDRTKIASIDDQYAIMVSCRCNYTASRLFFKQATSWQPRSSRDIIISVASEMSGESPGPYERNSQLPVQVLTLQASNLTSEDLTLTVLAPASFTSPPSVVSLSSPTSPMSPFIGFKEFLGRINVERHVGAIQGGSFTSLIKDNEKQNDDVRPESVSMNDDVIASSGLSCTHLWLQSRVPLGCIPSQSTATIKLELLPLTDGIITLDSLQIDVMEKGVTYIPERSLKINATSSISKGIL
ncbi:hypothetical protein AAZX31_18G117400 [Glycine max]|uniref:Uncharacterized protein n=1 Tax=Glycine max TaxID=3847 RepID=K7MRN9_SOYBN|nr:uncharacterized protein LOC100808045 [Glycine max]XP_028213825.1 uncharacterized protein LOC114396129 [Glycine soja]KAG4377473.1 hypothetical protein GLYMA_18G126000v4 [Glycine max]KAG4924258.1 hypothetical protein JHK87_049798 [Glycine soja]KAH1154281.1 hypothetical protein GYH30_049795 [Glycine max]KAH1154282.1 hypothetical protein GYH30_049795 [Glycine max]KAH1197943.1 hypothetical protein GmHk_18G051599 [Glycine max]|eukprot:XP_003551988.1 uncharacterized protein LOC100808045 [Glycine max]